MSATTPASRRPRFGVGSWCATPTSEAAASCVAVAEPWPAAEALIGILTPKIVDEISVGGRQLPVLEEDPHLLSKAPGDTAPGHDGGSGPFPVIVRSYVVV
jgi:hypothetical protein